MTTLPQVLPPAAALPPITPIPLGQLASPYMNLNPYGATPGLTTYNPGGLPDATAASLISGAAGIPVSPYPGLLTDLSQTTSAQQTAMTSPVQDQQAALAQVQTGIAKLATANPELAASLQASFQSGGQATGGGGGFFGALKSLGGEIFGGVGKVFDIIGRTAHLAPAVFNSLSGQGPEANNPLSAIGAVMTGQDTTNWNKVFQDHGLHLGAVGAVMGFGLDLATDPLTYLFSPGAATNTAEKAAQAAELIGTRTFAQRAVELGLGKTAAEGSEALTKISRAAWEGITPGIAQNAESLAAAEHSMGKVLGLTIEDAHRQLLSDMLEMQGRVYDSVASRTFKSMLKDGFKLESGFTASGKEVRSILEEAVKTGAGSTAKDAYNTWNYAKNASAALGGFRVKALIPFTNFRWISPALPFTDRLSFGAVGRFASGMTGSKQLTALIRTGAKTLDGSPIGYDAMRDFIEMDWNKFVAARPEVADLMKNRFGGVSSMFYSASDQVGRVTAAVTPGARQFRLGLGQYHQETQLKAAKSAMSELMNSVMHDFKDANGKTGRQNLYQAAESVGLTYRKHGLGRGYTFATEEDKVAMSAWLDAFAGTNAPTAGTESELRSWFDRVKGQAYHLDGSDADREARIWEQLRAAHEWGKASPARLPILNAFAETEKSGRQYLIRRGIPVGSATNDFETATHIHPTDVPPTGGRIMWHTPTEAGTASDLGELGFSDANLAATDLGEHGTLTGVALHEKDLGGDVKVWVPDSATVDLRPAVDKASQLPEVLDQQARYAETQASAREAANGLVTPLRDANPAAGVPQVTDELVGNWQAAALRGQGTDYVRAADGTLIALDPRKLKVVTEGAAHLEDGRGFFHRMFSDQLRTLLKGEISTGRITVKENADLEIAMQRILRHHTLAEAESQVRVMLRERLAANGASEEVLAKVGKLPVFEHDILKAHEAYTKSLGNSYFSGAVGQMQARLQGISRLSPMMYGRLAQGGTAKYEMPAAIVSLFKRATREQQQTLLTFMAKDRKIADVLLRDQTDGGDMVHAVVTAVEDGLNPDHIAVSKRIARYLDQSTKFTELLARERDIHTSRLESLATEADTHAKALTAIAGMGLDAPEARKLQEEALQAQLEPLQAEARDIMSRAGTVPVPADLRATAGGAAERADYQAAPLTAEQLASVDSSKLAEQATPPGGGFSVSVATGKPATKGFAVAIAGHETPVDAGAGLAKAIEDFKVAHAEELAQPGAHFGAWHDDIPDSPTFGKVVLDISHVEPTRAAAEAFGRANGQTAIYDLAKGESIDIRKAAETLSPDMQRLRQLAQEKDRIVAEHDARILAETPQTYAAAPDTAARINELDGIIDSKVERPLGPGERPTTVGPQFAPGEGLDARSAARDKASLERAKAHGHAEQLSPDIWVIRPGPSHTSFAEGNGVFEDLYLKLGADGEVVSRRLVTRDGEVFAESVRGLPHIEDISPGEALGRAHWTDKGINTLDKAQAEIEKQTFSEEGAALNKKLVRNVADLEQAAADASKPTADQVRQALEAGDLRVLVKDGKVSVLTKDGALRQGGRKVRPIETIRAEQDASRAALAELDQLAQGGEAAFETARTTRAARAMDAMQGTAQQLDSQARRVGAKVQKLSKAEGVRLGKAKSELQRAYGEMNRAMTRLQGVAADMKPAVVFDSSEIDHTMMTQLRVPGLQGAWAHAYVAEEIHWMLEGKDRTALMQAWREHVLGPWKRWATYRNPGFHVRNFFGAWFNNFLGGVNTADYHFSTRVNLARDGKGAWADTALGRDEFRRLGLNLDPSFDGLENTLTYGDMSTFLTDQGIGRAGTTSVAYADEAGKVLVDTRRGKLAALGHTYDRAGRHIGALTEDFHRVAAWSGGMRTARGDVAGARAFVMMRHGDYEDLTAAETSIKDIIPFYKWMRTNVPYQIRMLAENPGKLTAMLKLQRSIADAEGLDWNVYNQGKPTWLKQTFGIPLPGGGTLIADLPYSDLYMGANDWLSRALPVGGNFIESYGFKRELFSGRDLTGKMVPFSGPLGAVANVPGFKQLFEALPFVQAGADGKLYVQDQFENVLQAFPLYSRFRNWVTGDPTKTPPRMGALMGWLTGSRVVSADLTAQDKAFYYDEVAPVIAAYQSMGYTLPTKDQLAAASSAIQVPAPFDFASAYPTGQVA